MALQFSGFDLPTTSSFALEQAGEHGTLLEWSYDANFGSNLFARYMGLLMDGFVGKDYEKGLARFKVYIETMPAVAETDSVIQFVDATAMPVAMLPGEAEPATQAQRMGDIYGELLSFMADHELSQSGAPLAITRSYDETTGAWRFDAAIPLDRSCSTAEGESVRCAMTYAGPALKLSYVGALDGAQASYAALQAYRTSAGLEQNGDSWEHYVTDPGQTAESQATMDIYLPVK